MRSMHRNATGLPGGYLRSPLQTGGPVAHIFSQTPATAKPSPEFGKSRVLLAGKGCSFERETPPGKPVASESGLCNIPTCEGDSRVVQVLDVKSLPAMLCGDDPDVQQPQQNAKASRKSHFSARARASIRPLPVCGFGLIDAVLVRVVHALDLHIAELLLRVRAGHLEPRHAVDDIHRQCEAVDLVLDGQLQRSVDVALLLVAADVQVARGSSAGTPGGGSARGSRGRRR